LPKYSGCIVDSCPLPQCLRMEKIVQTNISVHPHRAPANRTELETLAACGDCLHDFERDVLPHLAAAHKLAHWLTQSEADAQDVVQEAYLRAFRFFGRFRGDQPRAWVLKIVRNSCYTWLRRNRPQQLHIDIDQDLLESNLSVADPLKNLMLSNDLKLFQRALETLSTPLREVFLLREFEGLSYKELSEVMGVPAGTVMSRLCRARIDLRRILSAQLNGPYLSNSIR
jgi:RNA polymerase sigma factor (sigma-70 family)